VRNEHAWPAVTTHVASSSLSVAILTPAVMTDTVSKLEALAGRPAENERHKYSRVKHTGH